MKRRLTAVAALLLCGQAFAQSALPTTDPSQLGGDVTALAATLLFIVQFIKRQFERQGRPLKWWVTVVITLMLGEAISALLFYAGYGAKFGNTLPPLSWILFGLVAAVIASGLKDLLTTLAERNKAEVQVVPAAPLTPEPGRPVSLPAGFQPMYDASKARGIGAQDGDDFPSATRVDWPAVSGLDQDPPLDTGPSRP